MKTISPMCLRALRTAVYNTEHIGCRATRRRSLATSSNPSTTSEKTFATSSPPNQETIASTIEKQAGTKESPQTTPTQPPSAISRPPEEPGYVTRRRKDDDAEFVPQPLSRPIGMPTPPHPGDNWGLDTRTAEQKRKEWLNYDKHLERRQKMSKQISKPYFRDWSNMRFEKGKVFVAPKTPFREGKALYFPNFYGQTLEFGRTKKNFEDGYGGLGQSTCRRMFGRISVVTYVNNEWAVDQTNSFVSKEQNPELHEILENEKLAQRIEIQYEDNLLKWYILRTMGFNALRKQRPQSQHARYYIVRRGVTDIIKEALGLLNEKVGYVYLVDHMCRIRWAGSAVATDEERKSMVESLKRLIKQVPTKREHENWEEEPRLGEE